MIASRNSIIHMVSNLLTKNRPPFEIKILSFKKDRSVTLRLLEEDQIEVTEDGFEHRTFNCSAKEIPKLMKELSEREFPRSHQVKISVKKK